MPYSLMGRNGFGQPIEIVQVVVGREMLPAGGTNGLCLQGSAQHTSKSKGGTCEQWAKRALEGRCV